MAVRACVCVPWEIKPDETLSAGHYVNGVSVFLSVGHSLSVSPALSLSLFVCLDVPKYVPILTLYTRAADF